MILARGDLAERIRRNTQRLACDGYRAPGIFEKGGEWPGDWQGRAILALCEQYEASGRTDKAVFRQLKGIIDALPDHLNRDGFFGDVSDGKTANEQQLSGNSWFIRGLCGYYKITGDEKTYALLKKIEKNFLLPLKPFFEKYPVREREEGAVDGHIVASAEDWKLSTDIGCAFILLDGISMLYSVIGGDELLKTANLMIDKFLSFDYCAAKFQTHAMLSATRGIVRLIRETGDTTYLAAAEKNFSLYLKEGTTVNYANFNWFSRPSSWTEPCAVVDSILLSTELYKLTGKSGYLQFANRAYFNALKTAQRKNGGAGCETCLWEENGELRTFLYEADFCCSMRLANGLNYLRENLFSAIGEKICILFAEDGLYSADDARLEYRFDRENRRIRIDVEKGENLSLKLYLPRGTRIVCENTGISSLVRINRLDDTFTVIENVCVGSHTFSLGIDPVTETRRGRAVRFYADCLLTEKKYADDSPVVFYFEGRKFSPVGSCIQAEESVGIDKYVQEI